MMMLRTLCIVLILAVGALVAAHARFHAVPTPRPEMLQTTASAASGSLMAEKNPVLLTDAGGLQACLTILRGQYLHAVEKTKRAPMPAGEVLTNDARFLAIVAVQSAQPSVVDIAHPLQPERPTRVALHPGEALVLPPRWLARANSPGAAEFVRLDDMYSAARRFVASSCKRRSPPSKPTMTS